MLLFRQDRVASKTNTCTGVAPRIDWAEEDTNLNYDRLGKVIAKEKAIIATNSVTLPSLLDLSKTQIVRFGTGVVFELPDEELSTKIQPSAIVLPCIFGSQLEGPFLLATGTVPSNVPFLDEKALRVYYEQLQSVVVIVDDRMTDNARNLATSLRINALFIVQLNPESDPETTDDVPLLLDSANINAVTALAGPQSLVLIQVFDRYYFYRGIANRAHLNTSGLAFGSDVTSIIESVGMDFILEPRAKRIIDLNDSNDIILPTSGHLVQPQKLQELLGKLRVDEIQGLGEDISAVVPQLQILLNQKDLQELSQALVFTLSAKIGDATAPLRNAYIKFLTEEYKVADPESVNKKNRTLGDLRKATMGMQKALEPVISSLANIMSSQTTSKRTHDLKRLVRQTQIRSNVEAAKSMTFDTLAGYLETYAGEMGVMLLNIETTPYRQLLGNLTITNIDVR